MKKAFVAAACVALAWGSWAHAVGLGPIALGFHLIPAIEAQEGRRAWDLSMSLGVTLDLTAADSIEFTAVTDSILSALGTTVSYQRVVTDHVSLGAGLTALWPITSEEQLRTPLFESFARVVTRGRLGAGITAEASASLPFLTVAKAADHWSLVPLAELPSLAVAGDIQLVDSGYMKLQMTVQPVITDTTILSEPFGRLTDDLLILPTLSALMRFVP